MPVVTVQTFHLMLDIKWGGDIWMQDSEGAVHEVTALLGPSSRNSLLSLRAGHTVAATGLVIREECQPAQEAMGAPHATCHFTWAEVI